MRPQEKWLKENNDATQRSSSALVVDTAKPAIDDVTTSSPPSGADSLHKQLPGNTPVAKVLPRLRSQRLANTPSTMKKSADVIKAEISALKQGQATPESKDPKRQVTPARRQPLTRGIGQSPSKDTLPLKYSQLLDMFKHLQMAYRMRKIKGLFLTFADAKISIQKATKKAFSIKDLARIKYQIPEILHWQYLEGNGKMAASARLVISIEPGLETNQGEADDIEIYKALRERLSRRARQAAIIGKESEELPQADLPDPSLAELVSTSKAISGRSWSNNSSGYRSRSPSSVKTRHRPVGITPAKRPEVSPILNSPKRLTTVTEASGEFVGETSSIGYKTPATPVRQSIFSPCSSNRQALRDCFKRRMLMSPSRVKERERTAAMGHLVTTLGDVRAVFHRFKATKRPLKDVLQVLRTNTKSRYTEDAALLHLHLLMEHVPQFIKLESTEKGKEIVAIDKECNLQAMKEMLKEVAEKRPTVQISDDAVERRLTELDELDL